MRSGRHRRRAAAATTASENAVGPADVEVALARSGASAAQRGGVEADALARADELVQPAAALRDELGDLVAQDQVLAA